MFYRFWSDLTQLTCWTCISTYSLLLSSDGGVGLCAAAGGRFLSLLPLLFYHCFLPLSTLRLAVALESSVELGFRIWDAGDVPWRGCSLWCKGADGVAFKERWSVFTVGLDELKIFRSISFDLSSPRSSGAFESLGLSHLGSARQLLAVSEGGFQRRVKLEVGLPARGDVWCSGVGPSDGFFVLSSLSQMVQAGGALSTGFELSGCKNVCGVLEASGVIDASVLCCGSASGPSHPSVEMLSSTDWDLFFSLQGISNSDILSTLNSIIE
ncbi:hypothetical protein F2Q68_00018844 [Brassica cretica]|uniref:Uncharacterized protein n=1 Tax=Brassica cretica TaxID=69181 RepID=A0A8S9FUY0_BRACR|nr:hypothetical protein F2Q68_00018844 [Brassica cretica]